MSFWVQHGLHLGLVAIPSAAMGTGLLLERRKGLLQRHTPTREATATPPELPAFVPNDWLTPRMGTPTAEPQPGVVGGTAPVRHPLAMPAVAISATGAALTHLVVMPAHFRVSLLYGMFFLSAATLQFAWAAIVAYRPSRRVLVAGALGCAGTIALWTVSRTIGIPTDLGGVNGGTPETVGALDLLATTFEVVAVIGVLIALRSASLGGGSPFRWPNAAKTMAVTALCITAALAFWSPVN